jgi:hypothetical protein
MATGVGTLPDLARTVKSGLGGNWSTAHRAADVSAGVGADHQNGSRRVIELGQGALDHDEVTSAHGSKHRDCELSQPRRVFEVCFEQPGTSGQPACKIDPVWACPG